MKYDFFEQLTDAGERTGRIAIGLAGVEPQRSTGSRWYRSISSAPRYLSNSLEAKVKAEGVVIGRY